MKSITRTINFMLAGVALPLLAGCGASEIASPGTGSVVINNPAPTPSPSPSPSPSPTPSVSAAQGCPTINNPSQLTDSGTISGPTGSWRVCSLPAIVARSLTLPKLAGVVYYMNPAINNGRVDVGCDGGFTVPTSGTARESTTVGCRSSEISGLGLPSSGSSAIVNGSGQLVADTNVTLTIEPGVIVMGQGAAFLAVNRGNKLIAEGTATRPIVFTSRDNVLGLETDSSIGRWGGVILMGRGPVTDCNFGSLATNDCERNTEGSTNPARFGGADPTYNAGSMKYVQIRYSGFILSSNTELQALTTEGIGSGTTLDYIQSHNSSDDGAEFFGGVVKFKHYIATGADDDSLDLDTGAQGAFQHVILAQRPGQGDALFEIDSDGNESNAPRSKLYVANFTALQPQSSTNNDSNDRASALFRGNSDVTLVNGIIASPNNECIRLNGSGSTTDRVTLLARSVVLQCNTTKYLGTGTYSAADVQTAFGSGANGNNDAYTPSLTGLFINGATETAVTAFNPKTIAGLSTDFAAFFDATTYIGAVKDANETWHKGWTCNSSYATFDDAFEQQPELHFAPDHLIGSQLDVEWGAADRCTPLITQSNSRGYFMATPLKFAVMLLLSTALTAPSAFAQEADPAAESDTAAPGAVDSAAAASGAETEDEEAQPEVSIPGGEIVVTGRRNANIQRVAPAVVSVLSTADIARTGEGNIAGALGRVTGLSVVGNGFVYVRGLGDRYSLALLNGSPLPSPEPLKRSIPLDLFPTNIVASSLVQKSYSVNFPGEFGGGVVNLTTSAVPRESFLTFNVGGGFHSETTGINGYTYYGWKHDWTGFDNGSRNTPPGLAAYYATGQTTSQISDDQQRALTGSLITPRLSIVQRDGTIPPNFSGSISAGTSFDVGSDTTIGLIATAGFSNKWQTRDAIQQFSSQDNLGFVNSDFERVTTTDRAVTNGLLGIGAEFGDNKIRTTALYIRDTLKSARVGIGTRAPGNATFQVQDTAWYERQLIDTQFVAELKPFLEGLSVDLRGGYANSQREAPAETTYEYFRTNSTTDPYGQLYQISLTGNVGNRPRVAFSDLNEDFGQQVWTSPTS